MLMSPPYDELEFRFDRQHCHDEHPPQNEIRYYDQRRERMGMYIPCDDMHGPIPPTDAAMLSGASGRRGSDMVPPILYQAFRPD
jgi:hypothetical protein